MFALKGIPQGEVSGAVETLLYVSPGRRVIRRPMGAQTLRASQARGPVTAPLGGETPCGVTAS